MINTLKNNWRVCLIRTLDIDLSRSYMPEADFTEWTPPLSIAASIPDIIVGKKTNTEIEL